MGKTPRFEKKPKVIGNIIIQRRDIEIIKLVWEYRFLSSEQIQALVEGSDQVKLRRLQKLYHHGYLDRPFSQIVFSNPLFGPKKMVYGLGDKGADLLADAYGIDRGKITWSEKNKEVREQYIQHTLMVSEFRACLTLALKNNPGTELRWLMCDNQEMRHEVRFKEDGKEKRLPIIPDGFFRIEDSGGKMYFFLEADRSTMTNTRYYNKMRGYWLWWKQGKAKDFGYENFRVLTITKSVSRKENLISVAGHLDVSQASSYMFWFTCCSSFNIANPSSVLERIWSSPNAGREALHSLLD